MGANVNNLKVLSYEQITDVSSSVGLSAPEGASLARIQVEAQVIRWRGDGNAPTTTVGEPVAVLSVFEVYGDLSKFNALETTAGAILNVHYYG